jgi:hypothetical protein
MRKLSEFQSKRGSVAEVMNVGICMIAMTVMMMAYFGSIQMMDKKAQIDQIARKYILRMETLGYLTEDDRLLFSRELQQVGAVELEFDGTTTYMVKEGDNFVTVTYDQLVVPAKEYDGGEITLANEAVTEYSFVKLNEKTVFAGIVFDVVAKDGSVVTVKPTSVENFNPETLPSYELEEYQMIKKALEEGKHVVVKDVKYHDEVANEFIQEILKDHHFELLKECEG